MKLKRVPFEREMAILLTHGVRTGRLVTRLGYGVRLVCFDVNDKDYPILGLVDLGDHERVVRYTANGYAYATGAICSDDLFMEVLDKAH